MKTLVTDKLLIRDESGEFKEVPAIRGPQGIQGIQGIQGEQGVSPTVTITDDTSVTPNTHTIKITDKSGTKSTVVKDGATYDDTEIKEDISSLKEEKANLEYVDSKDNKLQHSLNYTEDRLENVIHMLKGIAYKEITDDSTAYQKDVAYDSSLGVLHTDGIEEWACVEELGGKSLVWNQLVDTDTTSVTVASTHKCYTNIDGTASIQSGSTFAVTGGTDMVCDLTQMFGSGNEPSTVEEFEAMFPNDYYEYNAGEIIHAPCDKEVVRGKNLIDIDSIVQGYWSENNPSILYHSGRVCCKDFIKVTPNTNYSIKVYVINSATCIKWRINYLDNSKKVISTAEYTYGTNTLFTTPDGCNYIVLSFLYTISYSTQQTLSVETFKTLNDGILQLEKGSTATDYSPYTSTDYDIPSEIQALEGYGWSNNVVNFEKKVFSRAVESEAIGDDGTLVQTLYDEPIEIDISEYLEDDTNLIKVEGGGTITFHHPNADNGYLIPTPSTVVYDLDIEEATE